MPQSFYKILFAVILFIFTLKAAAQIVSFPQESLLTRIEKIAKTGEKSGKFITYETRFLKGLYAKPITSTSDDLEILLQLSLEDTPITYKKINNSRFVIIQNLHEKTINGTLAGKITDIFGTPLAGATIRITNIEKVAASGIKGDYAFQLTVGNYTAEVSFLGFETISVDQIKIRKGETTCLDVALVEARTPLNEIVITRKLPENTIAGALRSQQNTPFVSTVLSNQDIRYSAGNTVCDALKLIPGIAIDENNGLILRGAGGRWNEVLLDEIPMPNQSSAFKLFSFDLIPVSLVDNIQLMKSVTPDIPISPANAVVGIKTKDIPEQNFVQFGIGYRFNSQSTLKNQLTRKRGKFDFISLDDGSREIPNASIHLPPEHFQIFKRKTPPSQYYTAMIGRTYQSRKSNDRLGFILSISHENVQQQSVVEHTQRSRWKNIGQYTGNLDEIRNSGHIFGFESSLGSMLNAGWQSKNNSIGFRNIFSRHFENNLTQIAQHLEDIPDNNKNISHQFFNYPTFSKLLQNRLDGEHTIGTLLLRWNISHTLIDRQQKDAAFSEMYTRLKDDSLLYYLHENPEIRNRNPASSSRNRNREQSFRTSASITFPFAIKQTKSKITAGYNTSFKSICFDYHETSLRHKNNQHLNPFNRPIVSYPDGNLPPIIERIIEKDDFAARAIHSLPFLMIENRWGEKLRLAYGLQANYESGMENSSRKWYFAPSVNFTYAPGSGFNTKLSYQSSVNRPQLTDYIYFPVFDTHLLGTSVNLPIKHSVVQSLDLQIEKYIRSLDLLSAGFFYRHINRPIERTTLNYRQDERVYILQNSLQAYNFGLEAHMRKQLDFAGEDNPLSKIQLRAGVVFTVSSVRGKRIKMVARKDGTSGFEENQMMQNRPLSGQMPYQAHLGIYYTNKQLQANVLFTGNGRQLFLLGENASEHEYRAPHNLMEASVSYRIKNNLSFKLSVINLLDSKEIYYTNTSEDYIRDEFNLPTDNLLPRKTENYDKGRDPVIHKVKHGRSLDISLNYSF